MLYNALKKETYTKNKAIDLISKAINPAQDEVPDMYYKTNNSDCGNIARCPLSLGSYLIIFFFLQSNIMYMAYGSMYISY